MYFSCVFAVVVPFARELGWWKLSAHEAAFEYVAVALGYLRCQYFFLSRSCTG